MNTTHPTKTTLRAARPAAWRGVGFSITELLVVIALIAVLMTLLLVALGGVQEKARRTKTTSTMNEFSKACDAFQLEQGRYPGTMVPHTALVGTPPISSTELALLDMMGGARVFHPTFAPDTSGDYVSFGGVVITLADDWELKVDRSRIGEGPVINGVPFASSFTPRPDQVGPAGGQLTSGGPGGTPTELPDLLDAWGQPIVYLSQTRPSGPLVGINGPGGGVGGGPTNPRLIRNGMLPYTQSTGLGELGQDQTSTSRSGSILNFGDDVQQNKTLAQIIRNPAFGAPDDPLPGTLRGAYVLFSAGADGIYFSRTDGLGSSAEPVDDIVDASINPSGPEAVKEYDDVIVSGGG